MLTFTIVLTLLKGALLLAMMFPPLRRAIDKYIMRQAVREVAIEEELWRRARWDLDAAKRLRVRLVRHAESWMRIREQVAELFASHPEYLPVNERRQQAANAAIAKLDDTVRDIHGGWGSAA